jgi:electron transfer flavoprotein beta subunit
VKQVPDPEGPASAFKVDPEAKKVIPVGIPPVINPFDENALEAALRIKDHHGAKVVVISMGVKLALPVLRKALAAGADELVLLEDPQFKDLHSCSTAYILSSAIKKIEAYDLILTGRQAGDWDFGVTGLLVAEELQIPGINLARKVEIRDDRVLVEKLSRDGYEALRAAMPVVVTVSSEVGELRYLTIPGFKAAREKPVNIYTAADLEIDVRKLEARKILNLFEPHTRRHCAFIEGESFEERGENLAARLKEDGVI